MSLNEMFAEAEPFGEFFEPFGEFFELFGDNTMLLFSMFFGSDM